MQLFWERGYAAVSIADLTAAMGITTPSLYAAFGSKARLYRSALERYHSTVEPWSASSDGSRLDALRSFFERTIRVVSKSGLPTGCMAFGGFLEFAPEDAALAAEPRLIRKATAKMLTAIVRAGIDAGEFGSETIAADHGEHLAAVSEGLAVHARDGASVATLQAIARLAISAIPAQEE